ncbi:unnamed protein product, partial [Rotaria sp. Silwood1]
ATTTIATPPLCTTCNVFTGLNNTGRICTCSLFCAGGAGDNTTSYGCVINPTRTTCVATRSCMRTASTCCCK